MRLDGYSSSLCNISTGIVDNSSIVQPHYTPHIDVGLRMKPWAISGYGHEKAHELFDPEMRKFHPPKPLSAQKSLLCAIRSAISSAI